MYEIPLDSEYQCIENDIKTFNELPMVVQNDLLEWFNSTKVTVKEKKLLIKLYCDGKFKAWYCPKCGDRVFRGEPDCWNNFQGILNQDFSYFGDEDKYTPEYIEALCDSCRCCG